MKRLTMLVLLCIFALAPKTADADDGGWLDWLYAMDPKLVGVGTEVHLLCLDPDGKRIGDCEQWFRKIGRVLIGRPVNNTFDFAKIRHEIDFRFAFYWKYGSRFADVIDENSLHAYKLMAMYHYHFSGKRWQLGGGIGSIPFQGENFQSFSRGIVTPFSLVYGPSNNSALTLRIEESYITNGLSGLDFGNATTKFANNHEWNFSVAIGYDLRRLPVR